MKIRQLIIFTLLLFGLLIESGCDLPHQPGPMPSTISATEFTPGLNVLGVLRLDDSTGTSFIYIERAFAPEEYDRYSDTLPIVKDAFVTVKEQLTDTPGNPREYIFLYKGQSSDHKYVNPYFRPEAGKTYQLQVVAPDLPPLSGSTTVPDQPRLDSSSIQLGQSDLNFVLFTSANAALYEAFAIGSYGKLSQLRQNSGNGTLQFKLALSAFLGTITELQVCAYDANLAALLNATSSIMPQSYLTTISTVEGGYGCFGSVAIQRYRFY